MEEVTQENAEKLTGTVKWFDPAKGFGFIVADGTHDDVLLHANVLRNYGQSSVAENAKVEILAVKTQRGRQATEVLSIIPPMTVLSTLTDFEEVDQETLESLDLVPARVKWFDKAKGFGFANLFGDSSDIFVHVEVLRRSGLADLMAGEAVALRVMDGQRGKMAAEVCPWESGLKS